MHSKRKRKKCTLQKHKLKYGILVRYLKKQNCTIFFVANLPVVGTSSTYDMTGFDASSGWPWQEGVDELLERGSRESTRRRRSFANSKSQFYRFGLDIMQ